MCGSSLAYASVLLPVRVLGKELTTTLSVCFFSFPFLVSVDWCRPQDVLQTEANDYSVCMLLRP